MRGALLFAALTLCLLSHASSELEFRHQYQRSLYNNIQQTFVYESEPSWLGWRAGARAVESTRGLERIDYAGELVSEPLSWFRVRLRLLHSARSAEQGAITTGMGLVGVCTPTTSIRFCVEGGGLRRYWQTQHTNWLPFIGGISGGEWDYSLSFSLAVQWTTDWSTRLSLSTYESVDAYSLNNPFVELTIDDKNSFLAGADLRLLLRYQVVLGFGILDSWTTGLSVLW